MNLIENLNWRYATKKFNDRRISPETIGKLIEAINLSATSTGIQPFRLLVIDHPELRLQLAEGSFNSQISASSHLLVFAAFEKLTLQNIEDYMNHIASVRGIDVDGLSDFKMALVNGLLNRSDEENFQWAAKQAYIALGTALIAAADLKIDSTPMEGFDSEKFDRLLELDKKGLKSVVTLAVGYRDEENDVFAKFKKVRLPAEEFATYIS
jgi:nitroreductase/dihydropteridine reductase